MQGYSAKVKETSKELTKREQIMMKDTSNCIKLDEAVQPNDKLVITPIMYSVISIHNEKSDNTDYENYIIVDTDGNKYITGSESFWTTFKDIWDEMSEEDGDFEVEIYKKESKNYKGKYFLTCSIV